MSDEDKIELDTSSCCASCGIAEVDGIQLLPCDGCDLVRYCSDECQEEHRSQHEEVCKKRAAELRDELLFKQPEGSYLGDCPICSLPLPIDQLKCALMRCCSKRVCAGCFYANKEREIRGRLAESCLFCREPAPETVEEMEKRNTKRAEANNDPVALNNEGTKHYRKGDYRKAFEYLSRAAELGDALAHHYLARMYRRGDGVEKDKGEYIHHAEEASIGGHPGARYNLGVFEELSGNVERAVKHWIISATHGHDSSIKMLMEKFKFDLVEKEDLAAALRAHKAAVDATKSPQRDKAEAIQRILLTRS